MNRRHWFPNTGIEAPLLLLAVMLSALPVARPFEGAPRHDRWEVIGPGGGGANFLPTISPHDTKRLLVSCDMTGAYISNDGGGSWRMFNLGGAVQFFLFDPVDPQVIYTKTAAGPPSMEHDRPPMSPSLYRSTNGGVTWRLLYADSPASGAILALAVDPADSAILYAAFQNERTYTLRLSTDRGLHWKEIASLPDGAVKIYIDARSTKSDRTIYVIGNASVTAREHGAWRTGEHLPGTQAALRERLVSAGFPENGGKLVVYAIAHGSLFVSENGGRSWRRASLPVLSAPLDPAAIATSLRHPDVAYLAFYPPRRGYPADQRFFGVVKTADRGRNWKFVWKESTVSAPNVHDSWLSERFGPGWGGNPFDLGVAPTDPDICYGTDDGRTMRTTDGGATWDGTYAKRLPDGTYTSTGLDVTTNYGVHFDPFDLKRMFITYTDVSLFRSENGGKSWISSSTGVPDRWLNTTYWMVFDPQVRGRAWAAMSEAHDLPRPKMLGPGSHTANFRGGVCRSDDGGRNWNCSSRGLPETAATHILLDPKSPAGARVLYVTGFGRGVFKSTDGGQQWEQKNSGIRETDPLAWRLVADAGGTLYLVVARRSYDGGIGNAGDGALYRSADGAEHWSRVSLPEGVNGPHGLAVDPRDSRRLYLAAWARRPLPQTLGGGIYLSTDGGAIWRRVLDKDQHVYDVTIDPQNPETLYACGFEASAWRSADRGETWRRIQGFNFKWGHRVIPDPVDRARIYITTYGGGVWHGPAEGDPGSVEDLEK